MGQQEDNTMMALNLIEKTGYNGIPFYYGSINEINLNDGSSTTYKIIRDSNGENVFLTMDANDDFDGDEVAVDVDKKDKELIRASQEKHKQQQQQHRQWFDSKRIGGADEGEGGG